MPRGKAKCHAARGRENVESAYENVGFCSKTARVEKSALPVRQHLEKANEGAQTIGSIVKRRRRAFSSRFAASAKTTLNPCENNVLRHKKVSHQSSAPRIARNPILTRFSKKMKWNQGILGFHVLRPRET